MQTKVGRITRKLLSLVMILGIVLTMQTWGITAAALNKKSGSEDSVSEKTREISVVFDDSGSMFGDDRWADAAYAMQVFTAMQGENDTLNIYQLSQDGQKTTLKSGNAQSNVDKVNQLSGYSGTPYGPVQTAGDELINSEADEKWLVVLSDGGFNDAPTESILNFVGQNDVKVVYLAMGSDATDMRDHQMEMFYPYYADNSTILSTMTDIASLVYNYKPISITNNGDGTYSMNADVPLSKVIIFAQGDGASVSNVQVNGAALSGMSDSTVNVRVNNQTGFAGETTVTPPAGLTGTVYTAEAKDEEKPFSDGTYTFESNVENVEVFAEPGISVESLLQNNTGETINLEDEGTTEITEGDWTVSVQLINPLTGDVIDPNASTLLSGAATSVVVTDDEGNSSEYSDGDTVTFSGGSVEMYGRTTYWGANELIEKTSSVHKLKIKKSGLEIRFDQLAGYELDAASLQSDQAITFHITIQGQALTKEQTENVEFDKIEDTSGIAWEVQAIDDAGAYQMTPSYAKHKGLKAVTVGAVDLKVSASLKDDGDKREGEGTVAVNIVVSDAGLQLNLTMPDTTIQNKKGTASYMFDCNLRGTPTGEAGDTERPYILVEVQVQNMDGTLRQLTDEEWADGVDNFSFEAHEQYPNFLWRLATVFVGGQSLNFTAVQGDTPSTYKLYLDGLMAKNVLPNTSDLTVTMTYKYDNGAKLSGSANGVVSVKPLPLWQYLIWFIVIVIVVFLIGAWAYRMLTKPRFPRNFEPWAFTYYKSSSGASKKPSNASRHLRFDKSKRLSLTKPEQGSIELDDPNNSGIYVTFNIIALDRHGAFKLESFDPFIRYKNDTTMDNKHLSKLKDNDADSMQFGQQSMIRISHTKSHEVYTVKITFDGNPDGTR